MNNRNSIYPNNKQTRTNSQFSARLDRTTYNPIHNSMTKPSMSKQAQTEKNIEMAQKIMGVLNRNFNQPQMKVVTKQILLAGGSRIFYDVFATLAKAIDRHFDREEMNSQIIQDIIKVLNYPGYLNKTIFMPIGAPHTWHHCLAILDFMAEFADHAVAFKRHVRESMNSGQNRGDVTQFLIKAILENNPQILANKLKEQIKQMQNSCNELRSRTSKTQLFIKNMNNQQKSLSEVQQQIRNQKLKSNLIDQQIIAQQLQRKRLEKESANLKKNIGQQENTLNVLKEQVGRLEYKLNNIEVSVEESIALEQQIRQGELQYAQLQFRVNQQVQQMRNSLDKSIKEMSEYLIKGQNSYAYVTRYLSAVRLRNGKSSSQIIEQLSTYIDKILYNEQVLKLDIQGEINRIFTSFPWSNMIQNAEVAIEQTKRSIVSHKAKRHALRSKTNQLASSLQRLKEFREQLTQVKKIKQNLVSNMEHKKYRLIFKSDALKDKNFNMQSEKEKLNQQIDRMANQEGQLMNQIQELKKISNHLRMRSRENRQLQKIKFEEMKKKVAELMFKHKERIRQTFQLCLSDPQLQEGIQRQQQGQEQG